MIGTPSFAEIVATWAAGEPLVEAVVLIGSRVRESTDEIWRADAQSDWDFHIITSKPWMFSSDWMRRFAGTELRVFAARTARIGGMPKVHAVFGDTEADFVLLPTRTVRWMNLCVRLGLHRRQGVTRTRMQELAVIIRPGWKFLKGEKAWGRLYQRSVEEVPDPRLGDNEVRQLADGFVCDYVSLLRKITRGELLTAQRLLHRDLAETNFRLYHELRLRRGQRSFPEVRRVERIATQEELSAIAVDARLDRASLEAAVKKSAATCRELVGSLLGDAWSWPDV